MTPPIACGRSRVGDHQHVGLERAVDAVERLDRLAGAGAADAQRAAGEPRESNACIGWPISSIT